MTALSESLPAVTEEWAKEYRDKHKTSDWWSFVLLIVNPKAEYDPFLKVRVTKMNPEAERDDIKVAPYSGVNIAGGEDNAAVVWAEYCGCGQIPYPDLNA